MKIYNLGIPSLYIGDDLPIEGHPRRPEIEQHRKAVVVSAAAHGMRQDEYIEILQTVCNTDLFVIHDSDKMREHGLTCSTAPYRQFLDTIGFSDRGEYSCPYAPSNDQNNWQAYSAMKSGFVAWRRGGVEQYLQYYADNGIPVMLLGFTTSDRAELDKLWSNYLIGPNGYPKTRVGIHDVKTFDMITRYPWAVVTTNFAISCASAAFLTDEGVKVPITDGHASESRIGAHFDTVPDAVRDVYTQMFERSGFNVSRLRENKLDRLAWNLNILRKLETRATEVFAVGSCGGLF